MNRLGQRTISILVILIIQLVFLSHVDHYAYAPFFAPKIGGGPHEFGGYEEGPKIGRYEEGPKIGGYEKSPLSTALSELFKEPSQPLNIPDKILESTIKDISVQQKDSHNAKMEKTQEIFSVLSTNTELERRDVRDGISGAAYNFVNTMIIPNIDKVVVRFLASYFISLLN